MRPGGWLGSHRSVALWVMHAIIERGQELEGRLQLFLIMVMMVVVMMVMMMMHWRMASESWYNMVVTKENFSQLNS